ncbi:MAG: NAD(+) kinase [Pseudomonadales bacterium]|jgi:NAD+ kinase
MSEFNTVGLVARTSNELVLESVRRVQSFLSSRNVEVLLEDHVCEMLQDCKAEAYPQEVLAERCDLIIAVGGDGNILGAARSFAPHGVPILGINRGRLGFLADVSPSDIERSVGDVLQGQYTIEEHFLLEGEVSVKGVKEVPCALNEVLIHSATMPKMLDFSLYIDDVFVYNQYSDGLILASPTGSTAYALSAGGPIMHPTLDAIVLVPMFPHQLNSRPLVVPGDAEIKITVGSHIGTNAKISFDSQVEFEIEPGESLVVRKKQKKLKLLHPPGHNFYEVCRSKLDWASRVGN